MKQSLKQIPMKKIVLTAFVLAALMSSCCGNRTSKSASPCDSCGCAGEMLCDTCPCLSDMDVKDVVRKAYVGEGTSMHNLMLVNDGDTLCVAMDDSTVCNTDLVVGKAVTVTLCDRDGVPTASVIDAAE